MNYKKIIPVILVLFQSVKLLGQSVEFTYDDNGNRLSRTITVELLKSGTVQFPFLNPKSLKSISPELAKTKESEIAKSVKEGESEEGEISTLVYPNPNKGLIKIDISNMPLKSKNEMRLYNLSGTELTVKRNFDSYSEIDISQFKDGIYILRIKINESIYDWKVIKSH
jgi:hypothetical protein